MIEQTLEEFTGSFFRIFDKGQPGQLPSTPLTSLSLDQAYRVQRSVIQKRVEKGERIVGYKVGCTSKAIRDQFGLQEPIVGRLLEPHIYRTGQELKLSEFTCCALEPEFVFQIGHDLRDPLIGDDELLAAIDYVSAGLEVHNYKFWFGAPTSQELIASNGIHAGLVIGSEADPSRSLDLPRTELSLFVDDRLMVRERGLEIMDSGPLISLRWLIKHLVENGTFLRAGDIVIPGSPVKLVSIERECTARAVLSDVGSVEAKFV